MPRPKKRSADDATQGDLFSEAEPVGTPAAPEREAQPDEADGGDDEVVLDGSLVCALTGTHRQATPGEEVLQSFIEQFHREYGIPLEDMERDVRIACESSEGDKVRTRSRVVSLAVFEHGQPHRDAEGAVNLGAITRVAIVAKPGTKPGEKALAVLEEILGNLSEEHPEVFGVWTNGLDLAFRMRTYNPRTGAPIYTELADIPAPDETLADLENAERRPLRVATSASLLGTFKRCHDFIYGNQNRRDAFWQLLYLIFAKIHDEHGSSRHFFVGATERNAEAGEKKIAARIRALFEQAKKQYHDVFRGDETIELRDRALAYVAAELSRYSLLSTDADAKGMAYEAITSTTMKRERGQFFTPRNIIQMMVDMVDPAPGKKLLDPACGSGGFLVVALAHARCRLLVDDGCPHAEQPLPRELRRIAPKAQKYAKESLWGLDVDPDLRKAARMNMVMNNDGHGNIYEANSLELVAALKPGAPKRAQEFVTDQMREFVKRSGGLGSFDYVCTNPPFGAKIPVDDPDILSAFELGKDAKKLPPEILFIEACYNFLKPGTGVMAIVLPNGILGNPGGYMESVRRWMLRNMELLASVDLPAEAFLPQVSVQASCVFLRRRFPSELQMVSKEGLKQRPVFMAIAEKCGHGRRDETTWVRNPDGSERIETKDVLERWERRGKAYERVRSRQVKVLADDLPWVAEEYRKAVASGRLR
ncbi:restriction endonuclease subunit M [Sorangium sp. So ce394]|uniref:restriction endonuclease subunit M n=1 Tax=Sorangium sp. So ce394 TaxID=3133310 RepID=UPI003F5B2C87